MKRLITFLILLISIPLVWFYLGRNKGNARQNFHAFCTAFEERYALFDVKQMNWGKLCDEYSKQINDRTTDDELFDVFQEMLQRLDDKHCYIYRFNELYFSGFGLSALNYYDLLSFDFRLPTNDFSLNLIEDKYLINSEKAMQLVSFLPPIGVRKVFTTGWLKDSVAYVHMTEMSNKSGEVHEAINKFLQQYKDAKGYVIDIRDNIGGYSTPVKELAEYFTSEEQTYAISRLRNPDHIGEFKEAEFWKISPGTNSNYQRQPIAVLINENTQSAAELFALMMKTIPEVKLIGNTTSGVFADTHIGKLPNGWEYRLSCRKTNDRTDKVVEDIGIIPDTIIDNNEKNLAKGIDLVMDHALKYITN
jgi:C-terminal processing protease CtpA/Prc